MISGREAYGAYTKFATETANLAITVAKVFFLFLQAELGEEREVVAQRLVATVLIVGSGLLAVVVLAVEQLHTVASHGVDVEDLVGHLATDSPSQIVAVVLNLRIFFQLWIYTALALLDPGIPAGGTARGVAADFPICEARCHPSPVQASWVPGSERSATSRLLLSGAIH